MIMSRKMFSMFTRLFFIAGMIIVCNGVSMIYRALNTYPNLETAAYMFLASWDALVFLTCKLLPDN